MYNNVEILSIIGMVEETDKHQNLSPSMRNIIKKNK